MALHFTTLLIVIVSACSAPHRPSESGSIDGVADRMIAAPQFSILVKLSKKAEKELQSAHEVVLVLAMFDVDPLPGQGEYNPPNRGVYLGDDEKPADAKNVVTFGSTKISRSGWNRLTDKTYFFTINVFSARRSSQNNLLNCETPEDRINTLAGNVTEVSCRMIGEN